MTSTPDEPEAVEESGATKYEDAIKEYDPDLDDPEDDSTGYENDVDAEGDFAQEAEVTEDDEDEGANDE